MAYFTLLLAGILLNRAKTGPRLDNSAGHTPLLFNKERLKKDNEPTKTYPGQSKDTAVS